MSSRGGYDSRLTATPQTAMSTKTATPSKNAALVYQLKVTLQHVSPPVWRRILVPADITLKKLHAILQIVIGWTDSHLYQFVDQGKYYGTPDPDFDDDPRFGRQSDAKVFLNQVLQRDKDAFGYEYDFGDGWTHRIVLEKIIADTGVFQLPACTAGRGACPPEDCGGPYGYRELLQTLADPSHPEHEEMMEWVGGPIDPKQFHLDEVNAEIRKRVRR